MSRMRLLWFMLCILIASLNAESKLSKQEHYGSVVIAEFASKGEGSEVVSKVKDIIALEKDLKLLQKEQKLDVVVSKVANKYLVELKPFYKERDLAFAYLKIKEYYPKSFLVRYGYMQIDDETKAQKEAKVAKKIQDAINKEIDSIRSDVEKQNKFESTKKLWMALAGLGLFSTIVLIWSFIQNRGMRNFQKDMYAKQFKLEEDQSKLLSSVGDKIHDTTKEVMEERDKILDTPITKISKKSFDEKIRNIKKADSMLKDTTNDLIEFLKIKSGKITLNEEIFDLNDLLNDISGILANKYKKKNKNLIDVVFDIAPEVPRKIKGDGSRLNQILINLLENGLKFTSRGEVKLEITMTKVDNQDALEFQISDTGIGIKKDKIEKLFDAFDYDSEAEQDGKKQQNNSLGLYIAKEIVNKMGGEISAASHFGKGSVFKFTMPLIAENHDLKDKEGKVVERGYKKLHDIVVNKNIMIMESNSDASWAIQNMIKLFMNNVLIQSVISIRDNEELISKQSLLIIDERVLDRNNVLFLENIKSKHAIKVVALTTMFKKEGEDEDEELRGKKVNLVDIYLSKPLTAARIEDTIQSIYWKELESVSNPVPRSELPVFKEELEETANIERSNFSVFINSKILIGEPNKINQRVLLGVLEESGIECEVVSNGEEILQELSKYYNNFNLVIMNINMPIIDGYIVSRKIRENSKFRDLPIIAMAGTITPDSIEMMSASGVNAHISTPIRTGVLYTAFTKFLEAVDLEKIKRELVERKNKGIFDTVPNILDIQEGISRANDSEEVYARILKEFVQTYGGSASAFAKLVSEQRYVQAKGLAMDMKGITIAIGAKDMHKLLNEIHQIFMYNRQDKLPKYVERFEEELKKLLLNIDVFQRSF